MAREPVRADDPAWEAGAASAVRNLVILLAPIAPHFAEEVWQRLGGEESVFEQTWPDHDPARLERDEITIVVQVNGKLRGRVTVAADASEDHVTQVALADPNVQRHVEGKTVRKTIYVKGKLVNVVVG